MTPERISEIRARAKRLTSASSDNAVVHRNGREYAYFSCAHDPFRPTLEQSEELRLDIQRTIWDLPKLLDALDDAKTDYGLLSDDYREILADLAEANAQIAKMKHALDALKECFDKTRMEELRGCVNLFTPTLKPWFVEALDAVDQLQCQLNGMDTNTNENN